MITGEGFRCYDGCKALGACAKDAVRGRIRVTVSEAAWTELRAAVDAAGGDRAGLVRSGEIDLGSFLVERGPPEPARTAPGQRALAAWFGASPSPWLALPRSLVQAMPARWQGQLAGLLAELDSTFDVSDLPMASVTGRAGNRFVRFPDWVTDFRRPQTREIFARRRKPATVRDSRKSA